MGPHQRGKGAAEDPLQLGGGPDLHYGAGADRGTDRLSVGFVLVRRLLLSAKCLVLAAMQR